MTGVPCAAAHFELAYTEAVPAPPIDAFLGTAIALGRALESVQAAHMMHLGIPPDDVVVDRRPACAKLIGFGRARPGRDER